MVCIYTHTYIYIYIFNKFIYVSWSSCTKLAPSVSSTHGLVAQSVRASERNSVVVGSNPTEASYFK